MNRLSYLIILFVILNSCNHSITFFPELVYNAESKTIDELKIIYNEVPLNKDTNIKMFVKRMDKIVEDKKLTDLCITGTSTFQVFVDEKGNVESIFKIYGSLPQYDSSAVEKLKVAKFRPLKLKNKETKYSCIVAFSFFNGIPNYPYINGVPLKKSENSLVSARTDGIYELYEVNEPPILLKGELFKFPTVLKNNPRNNFYEYRKVEFIVNENGRVEQVNFIGTFQPEIKNEINTRLRTWYFNPALKDGKPVKVNITMFSHTY